VRIVANNNARIRTPRAAKNKTLTFSHKTLDDPWPRTPEHFEVEEAALNEFPPGGVHHKKPQHKGKGQGGDEGNRYRFRILFFPESPALKLYRTGAPGFLA